MVIGNGRKCLAAIVSLDEAHRPIPRSLESDDLSARLEEAILSLPEPQRPGGFLIVNRSFSIDKGELTPNLKLRRAAIETGLAPSIERLYARIEAAPNGPVVVLYAGQSSMK
jgi:long-chain acyl-CoA synthetase